jgi:hypothetical protein
MTDLALWCQSRMAEGGIVPPHSVLAPRTALGLLPQQSPTLRPGQLHCSKGQYPPESHQNKKEREKLSFGRLFDLSCRLAT